MTSHSEKENYSGSSNFQDEEHMKKHLFDQMKGAGILDGLKSQMRTKLYDQLKARSNGDMDGARGIGQQLKSMPNALSYKLVVSLIADFMTKCDMMYSHSVFMPECGFGNEILNKNETAEVMKIKSERVGLPTPLLLDLVEEIREGTSIRPNKVSSMCQTEEAGEEGMNID
jgi:hypothetical protein